MRGSEELAKTCRRAELLEGEGLDLTQHGNDRAAKRRWGAQTRGSRRWRLRLKTLRTHR